MITAMGYADHDPPPHDEEPREALGAVRAGLSLGVRLLGVVLLLAGLWAGLAVLLEGWALYREPARIERLAAAVEQGSHLDATLAAATTSAETAPAGGGAGEEAGLRLSYFAAWLLALALLVVIGSLAMAAVGAGTRLALGGEDLRELRRAVVRELRRLRRG